MIKWIKNLFKKTDENEQEFLIPSYYYNPKNIVIEEEKSKKNIDEEIKNMHSLTKKILEDLNNSEIFFQNYSLFPPDTQRLIAGQIINKHITQAIFEKRIQNIINDE